MSDTRSTRRLLLTSAAIMGLALAIVAQAQTISSPFAKKSKRQAWETPAPTPSSTPAQTTTQSRPQQVPAPSSPPPLRTNRPSQGAYIPPSTSSTSTYTPSSSNATPRTYGSVTGTTHTAPAPTPAVSAVKTQTYIPQSSQTPISTQTSGTYNYQPHNYQPQASQAGTYQPRQPSQSYPDLAGAPPPGPSQSGAYYPGRSTQSDPYHMPPQGTSQGAYNPPQPSQSHWKNRLGFGHIATAISGFLKIGGAATERNGDWDADFIADGSLRGEVSAVTSGGLEYGAGLEVRGQYDKYRRGFGGRVGDCPPTLAGCSSTLVGGTPTSVRGHTSQFYTSGPSNAEETELALEGAFVFLRSAYGDVSLGRDDGSAYLFSLGAPTLLAVGASNSPVDYTGLDAVKTVNDASGFSEKIAYTSPRLLGDTVGVGVQFGVSYALDAKACGVDYCVRENGKDGSGAIGPDLKDVIEFGVALDRKFDNGLSIETTATYAMASEDSGNAAFDDLKALGLGVELGYEDFTFGASYLNSNNALDNGGYLAWDTGLTWQPSKLGFTIGYGQAKDKNIGLKSDQAVFGVSYDWNENVRFGTGVQYIDREVPFNVGGIITPTEEKATSIFLEGRMTF